ncbi:MAG: phosphoribosylamine--glycine ligase, partial [Longimicrobiales bacterium]|nr:phosphoribosylamine--glycine ligase [Longimicrobiales bacterium]
GAPGPDEDLLKTLAGMLADRLRAEGIAVFGPSKAATRIESSKAFAKALMEDAGVPTAAWRSFVDPDEARSWIREEGAPIVVKASGLAAGKGAIVCETVADALEAVDTIMRDEAFGDAGDEIVIEAFMEGEELSIFGIADGEEVVLLQPAQDHKRAEEGDRGPNTGGMGAYAPVSIATPELVEEARERIFRPTLAALAAAGSPFRGLLYAGLMKTAEGLKVVEFNARFGDPETQVVLPLLASPLIDLLMASATGSVAGMEPRWHDAAAVTTVVASAGYPGRYEKGKTIDLSAVPDDEGVFVYHAGTARDADDALVTSGGRVLAVTAVAPTFAEAADRSRDAAATVRFDGACHRRDIGWRERERTR